VKAQFHLIDAALLQQKASALAADTATPSAARIKYETELSYPMDNPGCLFFLKQKHRSHGAILM
jgi:hypothetical protein